MMVMACGEQPPDVACELAGDYRLRVGDPDEAYLWWQLSIRSTPAPYRVVSALPGELAASRVTLDPTKCTVSTRVDASGRDAIVLELGVDRHTGSVTGRAWGAHTSTLAREPVSVTGVRDVSPPEVPAACFVAGVYALTSDAQWTCDPPSRAVGMYSPFDVFALRVQPYLDSIVIDRVEPAPPHDPMLGDVTIVRNGCAVHLAMTYGRRMTAQLMFRGDTFEGTLSEMEYAGGDSGGSWQCRVRDAALSGRRIR